ncbi:hypothetical protein IC582_005098 [Cucumis melo]
MVIHTAHAEEPKNKNIDLIVMKISFTIWFTNWSMAIHVSIVLLPFLLKRNAHRTYFTFSNH